MTSWTSASTAGWESRRIGFAYSGLTGAVIVRRGLIRSQPSAVRRQSSPSENDVPAGGGNNARARTIAAARAAIHLAVSKLSQVRGDIDRWLLQAECQAG